MRQGRYLEEVINLILLDEKYPYNVSDSSLHLLLRAPSVSSKPSSICLDCAS